MRIRFRFRTIPFVATVLLIALGVSLGQWQQRRAAQKIALGQDLVARAREPQLRIGAAPLDGAALEYRSAVVTGEFVRDWPLYLDNRPNGGAVGFYLLMPFHIKDTDSYVLVARGWLPRNSAQRDHMQDYATPLGETTVEGVIRTNMGHVMQLGSAAPVAPGAILQNLEVADLAKTGKFKLQPFMLAQTGAAEDALVRAWPAPALGVEKHQGYAFQWYALATMAFLFFVITGFRRGTN